MDPKFIKPDFSNNILNISATLAEFLSCPNQNPTLPILANELRKGYKNVVFLILDGLGNHPLGLHLSENSFLRKNIRKTLTSVFPSTTTNATTTLLTNRYPMEHGWFGWCLYFKELKRVVDLFPETDSFTGEAIENGYVKKHLPAIPFYKKAKTDYHIDLVVPTFWHGDEENRHNFETLDGMFRLIGDLCNTQEKRFIYAYSSEPDTTMHRFGVSSAEAHEMIQRLNDGLENVCSECQDTLFVITADHGQTDIDENIELYWDAELLSCLEWPPSVEARATAFKVKKERLDLFKTLFQRKYGEDFELVETEKLVAENYFGPSLDAAHAEFLGDFIAIGKTDKIMRLHARGHHFKGHHTSLTEDEMLVPLIVVGDK